MEHRKERGGIKSYAVYPISLFLSFAHLMSGSHETRCANRNEPSCSSSPLPLYLSLLDCNCAVKDPSLPHSLTHSLTLLQKGQELPAGQPLVKAEGTHALRRRRLPSPPSPPACSLPLLHKVTGIRAKWLEAGRQAGRQAGM